jgi:hypothetical protein
VCGQLEPFAPFDLVSRPAGFHHRPLAGRVEVWRAGVGRSLYSLLPRPFVCECHTISTMPRFQSPPRRTQHAEPQAHTDEGASIIRARTGKAKGPRLSAGLRRYDVWLSGAQSAFLRVPRFVAVFVRAAFVVARPATRGAARLVFAFRMMVSSLHPIRSETISVFTAIGKSRRPTSGALRQGRLCQAL